MVTLPAQCRRMVPCWAPGCVDLVVDFGAGQGTWKMHGIGLDVGAETAYRTRDFRPNARHYPMCLNFGPAPCHFDMERWQKT